MNQSEQEILRRLAADYAEAAAHPRNAANAKLYRALNGLRMIRPIVLIDEEPWSELSLDGNLQPLCSDEDCQAAETYLRNQLYKWRHHPADMILTPYLPVRMILGGRSGGLQVRESILATDPRNAITSHQYADQLANPEDLEKIQMPALINDTAATRAVREKLAHAIGDILPVRVIGHNCSMTQWDMIATYRGVTPLLYDLADRPEHSHAIMARLTDVLIERYRQYEELDLFEAEPNLIHCTAGLCDDLKTDPGQPVLRQNIWGRCTAQIFGAVSPETHEKFEIDYQIRAMAPFGLVYYGCCEPLDRKIDVVRKIPNLRKISITPWADAWRAAEAINREFVISLKPNPAHVGAAFDPLVIRQEITGLLDACKRYGGNCEIVLKDISTVHHNPQNLQMWEQIAMAIVRGS